MRACRDAGLVGVAWCGDGAPRKGSGGDPSGIPVSGHAIVVAASGGGCMESWTTPGPGHLAAWQPSNGGDLSAIVGRFERLHCEDLTSSTSRSATDPSPLFGGNRVYL